MMPHAIMVPNEHNRCYTLIGQAGDLGLYEAEGGRLSRRSWLVRFADGHTRSFADRPSIHGLRARSYPVPAATPSRWNLNVV